MCHTTKSLLLQMEEPSITNLVEVNLSDTDVGETFILFIKDKNMWC